MKNIITSIAIAAVITVASAQSALQAVKQTVGNTEILKTWSVGETRKVHDAVITRTSGENEGAHRTNVFYLSNASRAAMLREKEASGQLTEADREAMLQCAMRPNGGQIAIFFDCAEWALAGSGFFTVEVRNKFGETIFTDKPKYVKPSFYRWEVWYGLITIEVPVDLGSQFTIHVQDKGWDQEYAFEVKLPVQQETKTISAMR